MPLEWQNPRTDERGYRSQCNRYSVCSITQDGRETWQAWKLAPGGPWFAPLALNLTTESEARLAAELDAERCVA